MAFFAPSCSPGSPISTSAAACGSQSVRKGPGVMVRTIVLGFAAAITGTSSAFVH
jgi:hypothetical protein